MNPPRMSHSHSRIGTRPSLRMPEKNSQQACRPPSAVTVDHDLAGAILYRRMHLDRTLQFGRHAAVGVESPCLPRERGYKSEAQGGLARVRLIGLAEQGEHSIGNGPSDGRTRGVSGRSGGRHIPLSGNPNSDIRFEAVYVEGLNGRGNPFAHACPRCDERLCRRSLVRIGGNQEGLF